MNMKWIAALGLGGFILFSSESFAGGGKALQKMTPEQRAAVVKKFDKNGDGKLDRKEIKMAKQVEGKKALKREAKRGAKRHGKKAETAAPTQSS